MQALTLAVLIALLDQWTKQLVRDGFALGESRPVVAGFASLTYLRNTGAAWGMLGGQNTWLIVVSVVMLGLMVCFRRAFLSDTPSHRLALGFMIGGIVGNLFDRVRLGYVTDFLDFHVAGRHWPAFNIADSAICIGVTIYLAASFRSEASERRAGGPAPAAGGDDDR